MNKHDDALARAGRRTALKGLSAIGLSGLAPTLALAQSKPVNIGVILPLSGANAQFGINSRQGLELVADEINAAGGIKGFGGAKVNLVIADSTSTPTTAATVAQRMIAENDCCAILGAFASSLTLAISEVTERRGVPLLTMSYSDQLTARGFKNIFQVTSKGSVIGKAQFDYAAQLAGGKVSRVAIMYEDTAFGTSTAAGLRAAAKAANVQIVMDEAYPLGITDATPLINKLKASKAEIIFPVSYLNDSLLIVRALRQQKVTLPIVGGSAGYVIPDFAQALGSYAEGVLSICSANYDLAPEMAERYRKRFKAFMVHEAVEHAVALDVLLQAIGTAKSAAPAEIAKALRAGTFTEGWAKAMTNGKVQFDQTGLNIHAEPVMVQWQKNELVTVWPKKFAKGAFNRKAG
ncbi:ABC transporter substrate-binding protein [Lacisediminimonas profundi]|uniref:ABC transporter substrate-binding protein n=1 Tax=Lacisediminimonas profundi TaxID=2603856 RepID=UPI00124BB1FC|nr:ABC transporter substrate-binding protein [Lacisediminimonas profundi]